MGAGSCIHYRRKCISTGDKVAPYRLVAGVISHPQLLARFLRRRRYRGLCPSASSPVIEEVADPPGPKKQSNIWKEEENAMAERSVNKAILVGRLGADAETRFTQNGTPVSRVSLAMNRQWTDSDKQVHEETDWMSIVIWNKENLATYLTKGSKLYVEGRLQTRSYDDKEGVKRYVTEVVAENLVLLG